MVPTSRFTTAMSSFLLLFPLNPKFRFKVAIWDLFSHWYFSKIFSFTFHVFSSSPLFICIRFEFFVRSWQTLMFLALVIHTWENTYTGIWLTSLYLFSFIYYLIVFIISSELIMNNTGSTAVWFPANFFSILGQLWILYTSYINKLEPMESCSTLLTCIPTIKLYFILSWGLLWLHNRLSSSDILFSHTDKYSNPSQ